MTNYVCEKLTLPSQQPKKHKQQKDAVSAMSLGSANNKFQDQIVYLTVIMHDELEVYGK